MGDKKWIQKAIKNKGAFTRYAKEHNLTLSEAIARGKKSPNPTIKKRAVLAETLRNLAKKRK
ncbi:MAG: hypothetical protein ACUVQP_04915 [Bacteroidales bacterium]